MKKRLHFIFLLQLSVLIAGIYGVLHDQITYTISREYYTKFKFIQFGLTDTVNQQFQQPRLEVAKVGFLATWWLGMPIGAILGWANFGVHTIKQFYKSALTSIGITLLVSFLCGCVGLLYGKYYLNNTGVNWRLPENLVDVENYIAVGSAHNFGYVGSLLGIIVSLLYCRKSMRKTQNANTIKM